MRRLGFHLSIGKGLSGVLAAATKLGCDAVQIFGRNPRQWRCHRFTSAEIAVFARQRRRLGIRPLAVHLSYLPNLAAGDEALYQKSCRALQQEWALVQELGAEYLVLHPGHSMGLAPVEAQRRIARAIRSLFATADPGASTGPMVLLENAAGQGSEVGARFGELSRIRVLTGVYAARVGYCLDTAHAFAAGYPLHDRHGLRRTVENLALQWGLEQIKLMHLNDSKTPCGSRVDRHWHVGCGAIGDAGFRRLLRCEALRKIPAIMETPKHSPDDDRANMDRARRWS